MLLLRNSMHAISPMRAAALFLHRNVHNAIELSIFMFTGLTKRCTHLMTVYVQLENSPTMSCI